MAAPPLPPRRPKGKPRHPKGVVPPHLRPYLFKKGEPSANPSGRPCNYVTVSKFIRDELARMNPMTQDTTYAQTIAEMAVQAAARGDHRAREFVVTRTEGTVPQVIRDESKDAEPRTVTLTSRAHDAMADGDDDDDGPEQSSGD